MSENDRAGRIPKPNFLVTNPPGNNFPLSLTSYKAASIALFVISILVALARTAIRLRYQRRLFVDDAILLVAIVCLCAAMTLLLVFTSSLYQLEAFVTGSSAITNPDELAKIELQMEQPFIKYLKLSDTYYVMTWTTIFAVKFSFLFFFRVLIRRVRAITLYWQIVSVITVLVWVYCIAGAFIICPYFDIRACKFDTRSISKSCMAENRSSSMRAGVSILQGTWRCGLKRYVGYSYRCPEFVSRSCTYILCSSHTDFSSTSHGHSNLSPLACPN